MQSLPLEDGAIFDNRTPTNLINAIASRRASKELDGSGLGLAKPRISTGGLSDSLQKIPSSVPSLPGSTGEKQKRSRSSLDDKHLSQFELKETFTQSLTLSQRQQQGTQMNKNTKAVLDFLQEKLSEKIVSMNDESQIVDENELLRLSLSSVAKGNTTSIPMVVFRDGCEPVSSCWYYKNCSTMKTKMNFLSYSTRLQHGQD